MYKGIFILVMMMWSRAFTAATTYGIIGDAGRVNSNAKLVQKSMVRQKVLKTILPGDNLYAGTYENVWSSWKKSGFSFDVVALGNHNSGYKNEIKFFDMPSEYFAQVLKGVKFLVLNSDNNLSGAVQAQWLETELSQAQEKIIFVMYHHPSYTVSKTHTWDEKNKFQLAIRPVLWRNRAKITALILGHDHLASLVHFNDLPVILSGAVQEVRNEKSVDYTTEGVHVKTSWLFDHKPYWVRLSVDAAQEKTEVSFVRAQDDRVSCTATIETGHAAQLEANCYKVTTAP